MRWALVLVIVCHCFRLSMVLADDNWLQYKSPTVLIVTLIRNKAQALPYFLTYLEELDYPKDRISLWFRSDNNEDNSIEITEAWVNRTSSLYHSVSFLYDKQPATWAAEKGSSSVWNLERFQHIIRLKEEALKYGRSVWASFIFFLDADVFLTEDRSLHLLMEKNVPIVAPLLHSDGFYSNFWCGMSSGFYYERTDEYREILEYSKMGVFPVPMVHSAVLVNMHYVSSDGLTFDKDTLIQNLKSDQHYDGPVDDIIIFAVSANYSGMLLHVANDFLYGFVMCPLDQDESLDRDGPQLTNIKLLIINSMTRDFDYPDGVKLSEHMKQFVNMPPRDRLTFDRIYLINLARRTERRKNMDLNFAELSIDYEYMEAVDGRTLTDASLIEMGVSLLPEYSDPYHRRSMTMGEIGCFLSHYRVWKSMIDEGLDEVLVLEDDTKFEPFFRERAIGLMEEARYIGGYDLIYFGRKRLEEEDEPWVTGSNYLVHAGYSYWTLGYVLTRTGAEKLLAVKPLEKLIPVDEFLPIMFGRHPNNEWRRHYEPRNIIAWSAAPMIIFPTHYTGESGHISDTEDSDLIQLNFGPGENKSDKETASHQFGDTKNMLEDERKMDSKMNNNNLILNSMLASDNFADSNHKEL